MQTNILLFLLFSFITAAIFYIIPVAARRIYFFFVNLLFYFLCDGQFAILILFSILWSYYWGRKIPSHTFNRNIPLLAGFLPALMILLFFKFGNLNPYENLAFTLAMPLGLSYYTFKIISYLADIYLQKRNPENSLINYAIYISFFPQMICGPIARSLEITDPLKKNFTFHKARFQSGLLFILSGLFKKVVIADRLNTYVNSVFSNPAAYPSLALWMAAFFYTMQIYCDFAGYSEIAIGIGNLFGFDCRANFHLPYFSYHIKDFWKRWHISLSSWLQDYVYIPLGGNRRGVFRQKLNILITFFVSGLWHGNGLNYICWGLWHGILNLFPSKKAASKGGQLFQTIITFLCVMTGWIMFRSGSVQNFVLFCLQMFCNWQISLDSIIASIMPFTGDYSCFAHLLTVCLFLIILFLYEWKEYWYPQKTQPLKYWIYAFSILFFGMFGQNSFLYANF